MKRKIYFGILFFTASILISFLLAGKIFAAQAEWNIFRIYGPTRYETSFKAADALRDKLDTDMFDHVIVVSGRQFPDALSAAYLSIRKEAPILLTNNSNTPNILEYIQKRLVKGGTVYILGGTNAVSQTVEDAVSSCGKYHVKRLGGNDRYDTNRNILLEAGLENSPLLICTGENFADNISASATGKPILLVSRHGLSSEQKEILLSVTSAYIIGGEKAIPKEIEAEIGKYVRTERIGGADRYETAVAIAEKFWHTPDSAALVYGKNFPDGLCAGSLANTIGGPVLLVSEGNCGAAENYVRQHEILGGFVLGGPGLISDSTVCSVFESEDTLIPGWETHELSEFNPENVTRVRAYAQKLYEENTMEDYIHGTFTWDDAKRSSNWIYFTGLMFESFLATDFESYQGEIREFYSQYINPDGSIPKYIKGELDSAFLGVPIAEILNSGVLSPEEAAQYGAALNHIYNQLESQTIYPQAGNLWLHSQKSDGSPRPAWTKWNICLDGVFMSQVFLIRLTEAMDAGNVEIVSKSGSVVTSEQIWNDIYSRLCFVMENMRNPDNGLLYHGYCVETGETNEASWSRGIGWYAMALMEAAEKIPDLRCREVLTNYFRQLMDAVMEYQDGKTCLWYNVTDGREEFAYHKKTDTEDVIIYNMPESSGSAMFAYCLLRGYHCGLLPDEAYRSAGLKAFNSLVESKLTEDGLTDIYTSSSVTSNKDLYQRNGYTTNDGKGVGPLILAAVYAK